MAKSIEQQIECCLANGGKQADVAKLYANAILQLAPQDVTAWTRINEAVTARWPKGLDRVKTIAWRATQEPSR